MQKFIAVMSYAIIKNILYNDNISNAVSSVLSRFKLKNSEWK